MDYHNHTSRTYIPDTENSIEESSPDLTLSALCT